MNSNTQNTSQGKSAATERVSVSISSDRMEAHVKIPWPKEEEAAVTVDEIKAALQSKGVVFGIDDETIGKVIDESKFDDRVLVARGKRPVSGQDGQLDFKFQKVQELKPKEDADGRIDYKDIDFIQGAKKDQVLVEKFPPTPGSPGTDVLGKPVAALSGKDVKLPVGTNTVESSDGLKLLAACDGSIVYAAKRININETHVIGGDVCTTTGNINHNGSLVVKGKVESGFEIQAKGDVEIGKTVDDAKIISGGNIMVKGGFMGNRRGLLRATNDIHVKYVDDQIIASGNDVYIGGEAFNSLITAKKRVVVSGSKGRIVGGKIMAGDEIKTTIAGSDAGTRTELQVAYDAELIKKYNQVMGDIKQLNDNETRVKEGLYALYRLQMDGALNNEQQAALQKLESFKEEIPQQKKELAAQKEALEKQILENQKARIICVKKVYPGVILQFGVIYKEITDPMGPSYFQLVGGTITHEEYKPDKFDQQ